MSEELTISMLSVDLGSENVQSLVDLDLIRDGRVLHTSPHITGGHLINFALMA